MFEETATVEPTQGQESSESPEAVLQLDESSAEPEEQQQAEDSTASEQEQSSDESAYQLPDEQSKVFPDNVLLEYAENRYQELAKALKDSNLPEPTRNQIRQILHDKLNTDIHIAKLNESTEETEESEEEESEEQQEAKPDQAQTWAQVEERLNHVVDEITDPAVAVQFVERLGKADAIKDPKERAIAVTKALTFGMANAMRDLLPAFLNGQDGYLNRHIGDWMEKNFEGFGESYKSTSYANTWNSVLSADPKFKDLPAYGTEEWKAAAQEAAGILPGFENAVFTDPRTGKPLSPMQNFRKKAEAMANILTNARGKVVAEVAKAVETGKRVAKDNASRKANANLGAGHSKGQLATQTGIDPLKNALASLKSDSDPFASLRG